MTEATRDNGRPFFAYVPLHPPHGRTQPAPWYNTSWPSSWWFGPKVPRSRPNYGYHGIDKHWVIATEPSITPASAASTDLTFMQRLQMLLSVDDVIDEVMTLLRETGVLDNTYVLVAADHGWNLGEFRVMNGKHQIYEHTIRVPFAIRGPNISAGSHVSDVVAMVDVGPTLLELAGVDAVPSMDGTSFASALVGAHSGAARADTRTVMMVEYFAIENTVLDEQACRPTPPGKGPYVAKKGRGGCPPSETLFHGSNFTRLREVEATCTAHDCGLWVWSRDPKESYHQAFFCKYDTYANVHNANQFPLWTVGHRRPREVHVTSDGDMPSDDVDSGVPCLDMSQSHSDVSNNTFIGLRIINSTHDLTYAEYTDVRDWDFDHVYFRELYDLRTDPYQLHNLYPGTPADTRQELHEMLRKEFSCAGTNCSF